jgi:hypothetical protein
MRRRTLFAVSLAFLGCGKTEKPLDSVLPQQVANGWTRGTIATPSINIPEAVTALGVERSAETTYTGPASVRVRVFRMKAETSAFEMIQKWRQTEGLAAYKGPYFFIANASSETNPAIVGELLRALQQAAG